MNANKTTPRYEAVQGDYIGTTDNRRDRWYVQEIGGVADRRGAGYSTRDEALDTIEMGEVSVTYSVAFVNGADGEWDCVHEFMANGIDAANEAAAAWVAVHYPGRIDDWFVLNARGENVNG